MDQSQLRGVSMEGLADELRPVIGEDPDRVMPCLRSAFFRWSRNLAATAALLSPTISWQTAPMPLSRPT